MERLPPPAYDIREVAVAAPAELEIGRRSSPLMRLLPVVTAVATVGVMAVAYSARSAMTRNPVFLMLPVMMLVSMLATVFTGADRRRGELSAHRADYFGYLSTLRELMSRSAAAQHRSLSWSHPDPGALWTLIGGRRMWERGAEDPDFCHVRIGVGASAPGNRPVAPTLETTTRRDPLTVAAMQRFLEAHTTVPDMPIAVDLRGASTVCVDGELARARALVRAMICQLAALHGPESVSVAAVGPDLRAWEWLKWLPHNRHPSAEDDVGPARMMYASSSAARASLVLDGGGQHLVIVTEDDDLEWAGEGVTVLRIDGCRDDAPVVVRVDGAAVAAQPDQLSDAAALACAQRLTAHRAAASRTATTWPDLVGIESCCAAVPPPGPRLRVPVGTTVTGEAVELDINEAAAGGMGPHGLCIGATGSGKSEFLRTVALGMIVGHSPDELNMVLVDFKGGATFAGLEPAPHVAAVITNLSDRAPLVARMRDALLGEMTRRQEVLRAAGDLDGIAAYRRKRKAETRLEPLPVLFVIVDEFSELLSQQPEFAEVFVAIGRLGRSLGVHLLLASQRLDEGRLRGLESHLSYRVCLKTLSSNESRMVLGTSEAYELPGTPGAAYLRAGTATPVRFQTAYVSGRWSADRPGVSERSAKPVPARLFTAAPVGPVSVNRAVDQAGSRTVLQAIIERLPRNGSRARAIWLPPLGAAPALNTVLEQAGVVPVLTAPIGIVDRPFEQRRTPLIAELTGAAGNVALVGGPRSGKSTALRTLITALAVNHDPQLVQFYCLDFGGGALTTLRDWPHVGAVAGRSDLERVRRIVTRLGALIRSRETLFRQHGIESMDCYRKLKAERDATCDAFGDVFLIVDGWQALVREIDTAEPAITALAADGLSYGVHVAVSASRWAELRPALRDQLGTRLELRLGDPSDSELDRRRAHDVPQGVPGRGLSHDGLHTVIALPRLDGDESGQGVADAVLAVGETLRRRHGGWTAPAIPVLPARILHTRLLDQAGNHADGPVLGVEESELHTVTVDFALHRHLLILGDSECGKTAALRLVCREVLRTAVTAKVVIVDPRRSLLGAVDVEAPQLGGYLPSRDAVADAMPSLVSVLRGRMPSATVTPSQLRSRSWWSGPDVYLIVDDYDLIGGPGGNPLAALADLLPHAQDVGLHLVVARGAGGATRAMFEPLLAGLRDAGCSTLLMSASPDEGLTIGPVRPTPLPPGRGLLITRRGDRQLVQIAWTPEP